MANITELKFPVTAAEPTDMAANTAREAGRTKDVLLREAGRTLGGAISHVGGQVGADIDQHVAAQWIGHGAATSASLHSDFVQQWNKAASDADPNDTSIAQGFKENILEPSLEKFLKGFEGAPDKAQAWALARVDKIRDDMSAKITSDMGFRAGAAVHKNLADMERAYSSTVFNDHTSLEHVIGSIDTDVKAIVDRPNLSSKDAAHIASEVVPQLKQRIAQAAFDGMAQRNPNAAISALDHGDFNEYADAVTRTQWKRYAEGQYKIQKQDEREDRLAAQRELNTNSAAKAEEYRTQMYDSNTGRILRVQPKLNQRIVQDMNSGVMTRKDGTELIRWNEQQYAAQVREDKIAAEGPPARNDEKVLDDLRKRVGDPDQPTTRQEVSDAMAAGKLTIKSAHDLAWRVGQTEAGWLAMQRPFKQQFENLKHIATTSFTSMIKYLPPEEQLARLNQVEADAQRIVKDAYDSRDKTLMRDVLDPKSSKWAFKEAMSQLVGSPKAPIKDQAEAARAGEPQVPPVNEKGWKLMTDKAGNRAYVSPDKKQFEEPSQQKVVAPAAAAEAAVPTGRNNPPTYAEWDKQQTALRPAVEAKGWKWEPDRWNYFAGENGEITRELSPGRNWLKSRYDALYEMQLKK